MKKKYFSIICTVCFLWLVMTISVGCKTALKDIYIVDTNKIQTTYFTSDQSFKLNCAEIMLVYSDGTTKNTGLELSMISSFDNTAGTHTATVTYEGKTTTFSYIVNAVAVERIELTNSPKTNYYTSSTNYELSSAQVRAFYNDGATRYVNLELSMISAFDNTVGTHTATITYEGKTISFSYVVNAVTVEGINLVVNPKTNYYSSATDFVLTNVKLQIFMNDGSSQKISITKDMISAFDNTVGTHTATVTYKGKTTTFNYTVNAVAVERIELTNSPKTNYYTSSTNYELSSVQVRAFYNDGATKCVNLELGMISAFDNTVGTHTATITYEGKTTTFSYTVETVKAVTINSVEGIVTEYLVGDNLTLNNPIIYFVNNDGTNGNIVLNSNYITGFSSTSVGQKTMTISYQLAVYNLPYSVYHKEFISSSLVNVSSETNTDMPMIFVITKLDIQGNKLTIKYKENIASSFYETLIEDTDLKTFKIDGITYNLELGSEISLSDGTNKYLFSPVLEAKKVTIYLGNNLKSYYVDLKNSSSLITNTECEVYAGEKIMVYPNCDKGFVLTQISYGGKKYDFRNENQKHVELYVYENTSFAATIAESTSVNITFKLKTVDFYGENYDYGSGQQYKFIGQYFSNGFYVNNSASTQGVLNNSGDFYFTNDFKDGCSKGSDVNTGETIYIPTSYTWTFTTSITTNTELHFNVGVAGNVEYPLSNTSSGASTSKEGSFTINKDDTSTYTQQIVICGLNSRLKVVLEITVNAL